MHGNVNQTKRMARKQPAKRRDKPWKIARTAQRRAKWRQSVLHGSMVSPRNTDSHNFRN
jgi:hypothetical protein